MPVTGSQPVSSVEWVDPSTLRANSYNPNHVPAPEMRLLKLSIMEDGWTQPIVISHDNEIVDGFHRWTLGVSDKDIKGLTGGLVPVVRIRGDVDAASQRMSTIRHNRARGQHHVVKMADIVADLIEFGVTDGEIGRRLQMDSEEVSRLRDRGAMPKRGGGEEWSKGWVAE